MKYIALFVILFLATFNCYAQDFGTTLLENSPFKNTFNSANVNKAISELSHIYKLNNGNASFVIVVDSLPLSSSEILDCAKAYLEEAYKNTKYEIENISTDNFFIIGRGEFCNFESYAAFPNQYSFTCEHRLRIDAKDGRARLCLYANEYNIHRINGNIEEDENVKISDVAPLNPDNDQSKKMYKKAFLALAKLAVCTLYEIRDELKSKQVVKVEEW